MNTEQQQRIEQIREHYARGYNYGPESEQMERDIDFLLSIVKGQEEDLPPTEELTARSILDQSLNTLKQIRDLTASSRSYVPQDNAAEMILRLEALGFGQQEPRRGNTLWAMVMDAADEIERSQQSTTSMRSLCVSKVREMGQQWYAEAKKRGAAFSDKGRLAETIAKELESLSIQEQKS